MDKSELSDLKKVFFMIIPEKLRKGDEIRVIAPSRSLAILDDQTINGAIKRLSDLGLVISFGKNVKQVDQFLSSSITSRVEDIHEAFADRSVKAILTVIGGFNSNQLLKYIDYDLIENNPKILCGFSDITALATAIYTKTKLITYSGPHFSSFGMVKGFDYSLEYFKKCLMQNDEIDLYPATVWSNDRWWENQDDRVFFENDGYNIINIGSVSNIEGTIIGGNISTLNLLQGTEYFPNFNRLENIVLLLEECEDCDIYFFERLLQSLIHQNIFPRIKAILIGRFEMSTKITNKILKDIIKSKKELDNLLVVSNVDFGHTTPIITFPIGGVCKINLSPKLSIKIKG